MGVVPNRHYQLGMSSPSDLSLKIKTFNMERPYRINPLRKTEERRFWKGKKGDSYVTTLPMEWIRDYIPGYDKKENRIYRLSQIKSTILITPQTKEEKTKRLELKINSTNTDEIYYSVISAYLQDYNSVCLQEQGSNPTLKDKLNKIDEKLPGAEFGKEGDDYVVTFERKIENIPKKIDEIYHHYEELYFQNQKMFSGKIKKGTNIETEHKIVTKKEELVDNKVYALKRLFTHVFETFLQNPEILIETGLHRDEEGIDYTAAYKIAGYRSVANNLERLTDIQRDIFELLMNLPDSENDLRQSGFNFSTYYDKAHEMITDAYESRKVVENLDSSKEGFDCLLKVLASEDNVDGGIRYREKYISYFERKKILNYVKSKKLSELATLEGLIWGSTGLATNIAESWVNMSDLPKLNKYLDVSKKKK